MSRLAVYDLRAEGHVEQVERDTVRQAGKRIAGEVRDFDVGQYIKIKEARRMARFSQLAVAAFRYFLSPVAP